MKLMGFFAWQAGGWFESSLRRFYPEWPTFAATNGRFMLGLNLEVVLKRLRAAVMITVAWAGVAGVFCAAPAPSAQLRYVVIITRHGVRSPTWNNDRLNQYSSEPWPEWKVPPGNLTPHGRALMQLMGAYYHEWLANEHLLSPQGCGDTSRVYIHADTDQRTLETGRALAESLLPGCVVSVDSAPQGSHDPLFGGGMAKPDGEIAAQAMKERLGKSPADYRDLRPAFEALQRVLAGAGKPPQKLIEPPDEITVSATEKSTQVNEELSAASTLSEDLLLEYTEGMQGRDLGWGRLDADTLYRVLELHTVHSDLTRRTPYLARARGSNLLEHVLRSMEQAETGKAVPGALGPQGAKVLILVGHDTNLSNLSGMLGLSWRLPGYQPDDTPPGGALIFSLYQQGTSGYFVSTQYLAQTLEQMRNSTPLTLARPPARQEVTLTGCEPAARSTGCKWETFANALQDAVDPRFVAM
jgi:4-phytase/acid phosphatase